MRINFLRYVGKELFITIVLLLLFLYTFYVYSLPFAPFLVVLAITVFIFCLYLFYRLITFKNEISQKEYIDNLQHEMHEIRNEQLQYKKEVEAYFLTWVHQMKTPITASKLLLSRNEEGMANRVRQEIIQIDNYTNLALSYLKLLNHKADMVMNPVKIDDLIRPLIKKYSIQFIDNNTRIHYEKVEETVITDARWSSIMIEQILNNALKYARGKDIWIYFDREDNILSIKDNGIGISKADLPKIFDQGYSGYNGRLNERSSGIGLFIVKRISSHLSHNIDVSSTLGEGSIFKIQFPRNNGF
ncbi:sensor histidine kinase [Staphylococcus sp. SQ8-PEA]|uniref:histidine kinase n=1 Tax=Staphylococcus marylandisciuri TaxID=2981529 RepID=A0ABT2QR99_9STAP|nr:sensor histidine kinase [Staphylococcus marylandisciuri]MCU5746477.1 sensor histidine kinase [Staphylococcus marylandisciuri]